MLICLKNSAWCLYIAKSPELAWESGGILSFAMKGASCSIIDARYPPPPVAARRAAKKQPIYQHYYEHFIFKGNTNKANKCIRETREGWPLLTVETKVNGDSCTLKRKI